MKTYFSQFFSRDEGALTAFGLILTIAMIGIGGLALDYANAIMIRTHLQVAGDSAAHAAIFARDTESEEDAKAIALAVAHRSLPPERFGDTILADDIIFGVWDDATDSFVPTPGEREAVLVNTQRLASRGNAMATYFLNFVGIEEMDVVANSVFITYRPTCFREGFVAEDRVDVQSNNAYREGYCIHSNSHVELNSNNIFEDGVIVSMPYKSDLVIPSSGMTSNTGLENALRSGSYKLRILQRIGDVIDDYDDPSSKHYRPGYFDLPIQTTSLSVNQQLDAGSWQAGQIHTASCNGNQRLRIRSGATLRDGVIDTDCRIVLGSNVTLENVLIVSTSTALRAIDGAAGVTLGLDDNCSAGGGVQIVTRGGVRFTANLNMYGVQVLALDLIDFEANGNGVEGVSFVTAGEIDSTSNMDMGFCDGEGMETNFEAEYFRMHR
ncbi:MAG: hypothetical protein HKN27_13880 [Silicimonas sp.]|nr:hypothetical protein [Silicimonas sp.]